MVEPNTPASQVRAADRLLEQTAKATETDDISALSERHERHDEVSTSVKTGSISTGAGCATEECDIPVSPGAANRKTMIYRETKEHGDEH